MVEFKIQLEESENYTPLTIMEEIEIGLREVKAIQEGKISGITFEDLEEGDTEYSYSLTTDLGGLRFFTINLKYEIWNI